MLSRLSIFAALFLWVTAFFAADHALGQQTNLPVKSQSPRTCARNNSVLTVPIPMEKGSAGPTYENPVSINPNNCKVYYVIDDEAGLGQTVTRFPITGKVFVLDTIAQNGSKPVVWPKKIWLARLNPNGSPRWQILPVDWDAITQGGDTTTNYQIVPGDRIYVDCEPVVTNPAEAKGQMAEVLTVLLKAYDAACAEGNTAEAKKLARAALLLDPTCFSKPR